MLYTIFLSVFSAYAGEEGEKREEGEERETTVEIELENALTPARSLPIFRERLLIELPLTKRLLLGVHTVFEETAPTPEGRVIEGRALIGPTFVIGKSGFALANLSLGVGTGEEPILTAASFVYDREERPYIYTFVEYGGREVWFKGLVTYKVIDHLAFGAHIQSEDGVGPEVMLTSEHFEIWGTPMYEWEEGALHFLSGITWRP